MSRLMLRIVVVLLLAASAYALTPGAIVIKGTKKKDGSRDGGNITAGKNVAHSQDDIYYQFDLSTMSKDVPSEVKVKWVVLVSTMKGRLRLASQGEKPATLTMGGQPARVETPIFTMNEERGPKGRKFEAEIVGYGVKVLDDKGNVLAEKYDPESAHKRLTDAFDGNLNGQ